jgi:DNA-directed RNA polymerase specialized sigma24 family protein
MIARAARHMMFVSGPGVPMDSDTQIGGTNDRFPLTNRSMIDGIRSDDPTNRERAMQSLIAAYWKPVYKYLCMKRFASNEEAKDLTQGFFTLALEKSFIERYVEQRASFRTYLKLCVDGYVANERKAAARQKRGGDRRFISLDFDAADHEFSKAILHRGDDDAYFDRECLRSVLERATILLRCTCERLGKTVHFALFERYDLQHGITDDRPTYEQLAAEFDLPVTQITNYLAWTRQTLRRCALETLRELTGSDAEFRDEARRLFGVNL